MWILLIHFRHIIQMVFPYLGLFYQLDWVFCYAHSTYKVLICLAKWCSCRENLFLLVFVWSFPHKLTLFRTRFNTLQRCSWRHIDSGELRKVRRLTRHPFRETSKSELYFLPRSFEQKTYAFDANCVNSRFTIMCLGRQVNLVLPSEKCLESGCLQWR